MTAVTTQSTTKTRNMVYIAMFAVLISICSWISIPSAVPFTMQTFGIFLAVAVLGGKRGSLAVLVYLLLGLVGVPVFAGFSGGIGCLAGTTGGYIVGFQLTALVMWAMEMMLGKRLSCCLYPWCWERRPAMPSARSGLCMSTPEPPEPSVWERPWAGASFLTSSPIF